MFFYAGCHGKFCWLTHDVKARILSVYGKYMASGVRTRRRTASIFVAFSIYSFFIALDFKFEEELLMKSDYYNISKRDSCCLTSDLSMLLRRQVVVTSVCDGDDSSEVDAADVVVFVTSAISNKPQRDAVRNTWAKNIRFRSDLRASVRVLFIVGGSALDDITYQELKREESIHRDVIIGNFIDSYQNLTLKTLLALHWTQTFCRSAQFVVKTDDDTFVNVRVLNDVIAELRNDTEIKLVGARTERAVVMRKGKWKLSDSVYHSKYFPPYCAGAIYIMRSDVIPFLLKSSRNMSCLPFEDVYVTGVLASAAGVTCHGDTRFPHWLDTTSAVNRCRLVKGELLALHNVHFTQMQKLNHLVEYDQHDSSLIKCIS